jgi:hypothetical protein
LRNFFPKLGVVVGDDRVGYTEALDDVGEECYDFLGVDVHNGPSFNPLEELVNRHEVCEAPGRLSEWPHHLEMPHSESPCDGDGLKLLRWEVSFSSIELPSLTTTHVVLGILHRCKPVEPLPESFPE